MRPSSFNWRQSSAHLAFLLTFLQARPADPHPTATDWPLLLGEPPEEAINRFLRDGVLRRGSLRERLAYHYTVNELKTMLRERGQTPAGLKDDLIVQLIQGYGIEMEVEVAKAKVYILVCSDYGRHLIEAYAKDPTSVLHRQDAAHRETLKKVLWWLAGGAAGSLVVDVAKDVLGNWVYDLLKQLGEAPPAEAAGPLPGLSGREIRIRVTADLTLEFCYVPAGYFLMGSANDDPLAYDDEKPQRRVYLDAFYLGKYPITNRQYQVFVQATGREQPYGWSGANYPMGKADHPVVNVYWSDVVAFCRWAAQASRRPIRLLTEAEWEKGARGADGRRYPWGDDWRKGYCNTAAADVHATTPVGHYPLGVTPYGAYDMIGNVWEWTSSLYNPYPYQADDGREDMAASGWRVARGGSYGTDTRLARAAYRDHYLNHHWDNGGFRVGVAAPFS